MEEDKYRTVNAIAEGLYKEKGSRFISFIYPVKSEEEIKDIVTGLKTKFYDARVSGRMMTGNLLLRRVNLSSDRLFPMTCPTCLSW